MSRRWTSYVAPKPPKEAQNRETAVYHKNALRLKKVYYKNRQRQSYKAFIGLSIRAKMIGEGHPDPF